MQPLIIGLLTANILACYSRKSTGVTNNMNGSVLFNPSVSFLSADELHFGWLFSWSTHGTRASWMLPHTCLPVITITSCVVNSIKQPPGSHWMKTGWEGGRMENKQTFNSNSDSSWSANLIQCNVVMLYLCVPLHSSGCSQTYKHISQDSRQTCP